MLTSFKLCIYLKIYYTIYIHTPTYIRTHVKYKDTELSKLEDWKTSLLCKDPDSPHNTQVLHMQELIMKLITK